jgi:hypothetical protein
MNTPTGVTKPLGIGLGSTADPLLSATATADLSLSAIATADVSSPEPRPRPTPVAPAVPRNRRRVTAADGISVA